ncbi:MAG: MBL fold metallo-hydrolase [Prevotella sp.]|nr:MBL fold metallo-hydrolase [Prevotella sp.]
MITVKRFECNMLQENCYIVSDETREAVIIDCGALYNEERQAIVNYINDQQLKPVRLLATHGHFDHNFGNDTIWTAYGLKPEVAEEDLPLMDLKKQMLQMTGTDYQQDVPPVGRLLTKDDVINFGKHSLTVLPTPGHTRGSVTFYCQAEHVAFTGDTLFRMSIGRTDFEGGSWTDMMQSLRQLALLPAETCVYCGHGEPTTIGDEVRYNPYMR